MTDDDFTADLTHLNHLADKILNSNPPIPLAQTWAQEDLLTG